MKKSGMRVITLLKLHFLILVLITFILDYILIRIKHDLVLCITATIKRLDVKSSYSTFG